MNFLELWEACERELRGTRQWCSNSFDIMGTSGNAADLSITRQHHGKLFDITAASSLAAHIRLTRQCHDNQVVSSVRAW